MKKGIIIFLSWALISVSLGCKGGNKDELKASEPGVSLDQEKKAILETLNRETQAAFSRDYSNWQDKWVHEPFVTKTYIDYPENTFTETLGWEEVNRFVVGFFEEHPKPEPLPEPLADIEVRLYGGAAWVTYEQVDSLRGLKRETRLMEKDNGKWKIAGMHTTIYGFGDN